MDSRTFTVREMTIEDYDGLRALWMTIRGFGIRSLDDSREGVARFLQRNPGISISVRRLWQRTVRWWAAFCVDTTAEEGAFIMCVSGRITGGLASVRLWWCAV